MLIIKSRCFKIKKNITIILFSIVLLVGLFYHQVFLEREEVNMIDDIECRSGWMERLDLLYSDETYAKLGDLFVAIEDKLEYFVAHLYENDLHEALAQVAIDFPLTEHEALLSRGRSVREWRRFVIYNAEIVTETSDEHLVKYFEEHHELLNIIKDMDEQGVILRINISGTEDCGMLISFDLSREHTIFTERLVPYTQTSFLYIREYELERSLIESERMRNIAGNWYMSIMQPFKLGDQPIPLED